MDEESPLWIEIGEAVKEAKLGKQLDYKTVEFTIKIDKNWIETLEQLIEAVLADSQSSPEGALEANIFKQIQQQL